MRLRRPRGEVASFADSDERLAAVLSELEDAQNYKAWLLDLITPSVHGCVLEVGAGQGTFSPDLRQLGESLTAVEPSSAACAHLRLRVAGLANVHVVEGTLDGISAPLFDSAVMLNVLEHIDDDVRTVKQIYSLLGPGGELSIWVPAFMMLYGRFDRQVGHHRRYTKQGMKRLLHEAGFQVTTCRYANFPGFFAWLVVVRIFGSHPTSAGLSRIYDRFIVPLTRRIERRIVPPFGQSLFVVAKRVN